MVISIMSSASAGLRPHTLTRVLPLDAAWELLSPVPLVLSPSETNFCLRPCVPKCFDLKSLQFRYCKNCKKQYSAKHNYTETFDSPISFMRHHHHTIIIMHCCLWSTLKSLSSEWTNTNTHYLGLGDALSPSVHYTNVQLRSSLMSNVVKKLPCVITYQYMYMALYSWLHSCNKRL